MAKTVVIDEILVTFRVASQLPDAQAEATHRVLTSDEFIARLRRAVRTVIRGSRSWLSSACR